MDIYTVFAVTLLVLRGIDFKYPRIQNKKYILFWISTILIMFLIGFRSYLVGPDMPTYTQSYLGYESGYTELIDSQPIIFAWMNFLKLFCPREPFYFVFFTMLVTLIPFIWGVRKYSNDKIGSLIGLMVFEGTLMMYVVTIRQGLAISFILIALYSYFERPRFWWGITIGCGALALLCHSSSYMVIPIIGALCFFNIKKSRWIYVVLLATIFLGEVLGKTVGSLAFDIINSTDSMERLSGYEGTDYTSDGVTRIRVYFPMTILACWVVYCSKMKNLTFFEKLLLAGVVLYNVTSGIMGHLTQRFVAPFYLIACLGALPAMKKQKWPIVTLILIAYIIQKHNGYIASDFMTYRFIWE